MKFTKGCLIAIGGVVILTIIISVMVNSFTNSGEETIPTMTQPATTQTATTTPPPSTAQSPAEQVELIEAESQGLLEVNGSGRSSITSIQIKIISKSDKSLQVTILPGTMFIAGTGVQNMVATAKRVIFLERNATVNVSIIAACANMHLNVPEATDSFELGSEPIPEDLIKLLALEDFTENSVRTMQFAIWTITDNPERDDYVGIGSFGIGTGPTDEELAAIIELFRRAGISISQYQALN